MRGSRGQVTDEKICESKFASIGDLNHQMLFINALIRLASKMPAQDPNSEYMALGPSPACTAVLRQQGRADLEKLQQVMRDQKILGSNQALGNHIAQSIARKKQREQSAHVSATAAVVKPKPSSPSPVSRVPASVPQFSAIDNGMTFRQTGEMTAFISKLIALANDNSSDHRRTQNIEVSDACADLLKGQDAKSLHGIARVLKESGEKNLINYVTKQINDRESKARPVESVSRRRPGQS